MTIRQLHNNIIQYNESEIIFLISDSRKELKLLFINLSVEFENTEMLGQILVHLSSLPVSNDAKQTEELQFLFTELAFYFKRSNNHAFVVNCLRNISDSVLKNRLNAWIQYKLYTSINSHITRFREYLQKLSTAITDGFEDYENDVLRDLNDYHNYAKKLFSENNEYELLKQFESQFENDELQNDFPVLKDYSLNKFQFSNVITIHDIKDKIFEPSIFTENLFNVRFWNYIRNHSKTNWHQILLGYDSFFIRSEI
ncbi:MAG: hypothetical protein ABI729_06250, partial [Chitinophagales bacterium]